MSKYNLEEQLSKLSDKQIQNMIQKRMLKDVELSQLIRQYDEYPYNEYKKWVTKVNNWNKEQEDIVQWMDAAFVCVSKEFWDQTVGQVVTDKKGQNHQLIDCWHSDEMGY